MKADQTPRVLGRYALYDKIAHGGMATVHLGRLLGPVGFARTVAIKRLHDQFAGDPEFVSMFLDEARLVARISHPNVVPTLDVVATDGELLLVMEYVHGESLARLARAAQKQATRIPADMCGTVMAGVLHGLHAAHEATSERGEPLGIVHRDVSPQNVLVGVDGAARVLDFGVAKSLVRLQTTREGQLKGKLAYMAPEQIHGSVTRATDTYAASIVLWELLAGRRLFDGNNEAQILNSVLKGCQMPPSSFGPVPAELDAVTLRGLEIDPARRFSTARDMARALEDATPPVASSKIGEWVESMMGQELSERRERIAAIESSSSRLLPRVGPPTTVEPQMPTLATPPPVMGPIEDNLPTQLSTGSISAPGRSPIRPRKARSIPIMAGALGTVAVGTWLLATWMHRSGSASSVSAATLPNAGAVPAEAAEPLPPSTDAALIAEGSRASAPAAYDSAAAPSASSAPTIPPRAAAPTTAPGRGSSPTAPSRCNPPWTVDARGVRSFKKDCL